MNHEPLFSEEKQQGHKASLISFLSSLLLGNSSIFFFCGIDTKYYTERYSNESMRMRDCRAIDERCKLFKIAVAENEKRQKARYQTIYIVIVVHVFARMSLAPLFLSLFLSVFCSSLCFCIKWPFWLVIFFHVVAGLPLITMSMCCIVGCRSLLIEKRVI